MEFIIQPIPVVNEVTVQHLEYNAMHFCCQGMLIPRVILHSVGKVIPNFLTPRSSEEASLMMSRRLGLFIVIQTGLWDENLDHNSCSEISALH